MCRTCKCTGHPDLVKKKAADSIGGGVVSLAPLTHTHRRHPQTLSPNHTINKQSYRPHLSKDKKNFSLAQKSASTALSPQHLSALWLVDIRLESFRIRI